MPEDHPGVALFQRVNRQLVLTEAGAACLPGIRAAFEGPSVVVISSYLPEIMNLSDRILVCRQGRIVEELSPEDATEEKIMYAAVH